MRRSKVLLSAFACAPARGSELGVGWNTARELARHHEVWVLTQGMHRSSIEGELLHNPIPHLHFAYYDLPRWVGWWRHGQRGVQPYYYLWQLGAQRVARRLHHEIEFDSAQHTTFVVYWKPSLLAMLPIPFIWGPIGGGESAPEAFRPDFGLRGRAYEMMRDLARWVGEHDPLVQRTARRSDLALATTQETAARLRKLGVKDVRLFSQVGLAEEELERLVTAEARRGQHPMRFASVGRLLHWKGFHLGLRAFAHAGSSDAEYWMIGDGPERGRLQALAKELGIADRVVFWGRL
jgi:glycosyltransferase involved in cell wall biosynthesis